MTKGRTLGPLWRLKQMQRIIGGKPFVGESISTRQQERATDRKASFATVNQHYGLEPRKARRGIALVWARNLMRDRRKYKAAA